MNMLDGACRAWLGPDAPLPGVVDGRFFWYGGFSRSDYIFARVNFPCILLSFYCFSFTHLFLIYLQIQQLVIEAYLRDGSSIAIGTPNAGGSVKLRRRLDDVANYRWPPTEWDIAAAHGAPRRGGVIRQGEDIAARLVAPFLRPSAVAARGRVDSGQRGGRGGGVPRGSIRQPQDVGDDAAHNAEIDALIAGAADIRNAAQAALAAPGFGAVVAGEHVGGAAAAAAAAVNVAGGAAAAVGAGV